KALKGKITIILTTHYLEEAESLSDRVGVMKSGKLLFCGTSQELISSTGADSFEDAFIKTVKEETV
ncbi:MAG: ABC transporter ATP-binding protein, partial [Oscillospiraceae bacterium]